MKVQRVRFCRQCQELLPTRCSKCIVHPERKPRIVSIYDSPPILATGPCGCVKISCQYAGCKAKRFMWRRLKHDGTLAQHNHYCTQECARADIAQARTTRVTVTCSYKKCGVKFERKPSEVKGMRHAFHTPKCFYLHRVENRVDTRRPVDDDSIGMMMCLGRCRSVTDHNTPKKGAASCRACGTPRPQDTAAIGKTDTQDLSAKTRSLSAA